MHEIKHQHRGTPHDILYQYSQSQICHSQSKWRRYSKTAEHSKSVPQAESSQISKSSDSTSSTTYNILPMQTNIYRMIHSILDSPDMFAQLTRRYASLMNMETCSATHRANATLTRLALQQCRPQASTLKKIAMSWKDEMQDTRSIEEISHWLLLPYEYTLLLPYLKNHSPIS